MKVESILPLRLPKLIVEREGEEERGGEIDKK